MKPTFIVTSAIDTNVGVYSPDIRILQTHETVNSIQKYFPDALLILAVFQKTTPHTPLHVIDLCKRRIQHHDTNQPKE
jgi:phage-related protein